MRELGQDVYGFNAAIGLRVDPQDNVWTIDEAASQVVKFDAEGRVALVLGRKPEAIAVRPAPGGGRGGRRVVAATGGGGGPAAGGAGGRWRRLAAGAAARPEPGTPGSTFNRPTDVAWDRAGNIYIADGIGNNNRVAKFDKDGNFIKQWGSTGSENGQFNGVKSLAVDAQGNVYVADVGNKRIQVFDARRQLQVAVRQRRHAAHDVHDDGRDAVSLHLALGRPRRHGRRRDLQGRSSTERSSASSARPASCRSSSVSPTRSTAATRTSCSSAR